MLARLVASVFKLHLCNGFRRRAAHGKHYGRKTSRVPAMVAARRAGFSNVPRDSLLEPRTYMFDRYELGSSLADCGFGGRVVQGGFAKRKLPPPILILRLND
jgi:hypothetical protein